MRALRRSHPGQAEFAEMLASSTGTVLLSRNDYRVQAASLFDGLDADGIEWHVVNERRFDVELNGRILSGSIDRLVLFLLGGRLAAADILDYKTDQLPPGDPAAVTKMAEHYSEQLRAYAEAVSQMYGLPRERIATRLVLLSLPEVVQVQ